MPGLADSHVHLMEEADLQQFLFYGVTTVRNLMGSGETLRLKRAVAEGTLIGPRIITSGPLLAGPGVPWRSADLDEMGNGRRPFHAHILVNYWFFGTPARV